MTGGGVRQPGPRESGPREPGLREPGPREPGPREPGLRERKKQRTRRALIEAAVALFARKGYEETTIAEIAESVEVSPRTFFSHFAKKEDVLFAHTDERVRLALEAIAGRHPDEPAASTLLRAFQQVATSEAFTADLGGRLAGVRLDLLSRSPALQAAALRRLLAAQHQIAEALHRAYPELDRVAAAAMVGALVGAVVGTVGVSVRRGDDPAGVRSAYRRGVQIAVHGIGSVDRVSSVDGAGGVREGAGGSDAGHEPPGPAPAD
ncbi:MAG TPA: TetR/AcrR family transcriptional regulator [Natronosporangium sp.]|nr:TetR/AcrR family transcriptional regulator [Natronosporangium sp.]